MLLLDQMSGGHVVGRNVFSTTFLLLPLTYAHAFSLPSPLPKDIAVLFPSLPRFNTKESVWNRILPACNYRSTIQDKVQRVWKCTLHVQLFNELHCWINDPSRQQCSLLRVCNFRIEIGCISKLRICNLERVSSWSWNCASEILLMQLI